MISGAEAARIGRALASVAGWTSEIVVVLNEEVRDGTEEIAAKYGAQVVREPWHGFRDQKKIALRLVTQPWVLCLDTDEEVSPELRDSICRFVSAPGERFVGAYFARKVWFLGRWITHGDWYPDYSLRLIKNGCGKWGGSPEHDKIEPDGPVTKLPGDLYHYTNPTISDFVRKINQFSDYYLQRQLEAGSGWSAPSVIIRSVWRFFRAYIFRLGFLDGYPGLFIAVSNAYATFVKHSRLYEHSRSGRPPSPPGNSAGPTRP